MNGREAFGQEEYVCTQNMFMINLIRNHVRRKHSEMKLLMVFILVE